MHHYLLPLSSTLFRLAAYLFLQIIPTSLGKLVLPTLYFSYISTFFLLNQESPDEDSDTKYENGDAKPLPPPPQISPPDPVSTLVFSLHTPTAWLRWTNFALNAVLVLACLDMALTPFWDAATDVAYTRVGAVYPDSVKIQVRSPQNTDALQVLYREFIPAGEAEGGWKTGPLVPVTEEWDWVGTVRLIGLWPGTKYEYVIASTNGTILPVSTQPVRFSTFPDPRMSAGSRFRFVASSCITPNFPYRGPWNKRQIKGFDLLADYLERQGLIPNVTLGGNETLLELPEAKPDVDFMMFLGDFVYADVPVYVGDDKGAYERLYRRNFASPSFRRVYEQLPIIHAYDDHEVPFINNYAGNAEDRPPYVNASAAYSAYAGNANYDASKDGEMYYTFEHGDAAFFVLDTRRYRTAPSSSAPADEQPTPTMLGTSQLLSLQNWLHLTNGTKSWKFIVSSVPFTSLWTHDAQVDSWAAFEAEKEALLKLMGSVGGVVVISGDRHEFAVIELLTEDGGLVREVSTSPLSMFYIPFVRTLKEKSEKVWKRNVSVDLGEEGVVTEEVEVPRERVVKYIPVGNVKWSTFEVDSRDRKRPVLRVETVVDGEVASSLEFVAPPLRPSVTSLGSLVTTNFKDLFDKIGVNPGRWF